MVVKIITSNCIGSSSGGSLVKKIRRLLEIFLEVVVHNSYREINQYVNALAKHDCSLGSSIMFYESYPV